MTTNDDSDDGIPWRIRMIMVDIFIIIAGKLVMDHFDFPGWKIFCVNFLLCLAVNFGKTNWSSR